MNLPYLAESAISGRICQIAYREKLKYDIIYFSPLVCHSRFKYHTAHSQFNIAISLDGVRYFGFVLSEQMPGPLYESKTP